MRRNEFAVVAVVALLLLGGCTAGSPTDSGTTGAEKTTATTVSATTTNSETGTTETRTTETETTGTPATTSTGGSLFDGNGSQSLFDGYGVATNYSADGDLNAEQVVRTHLKAVGEVESVTVASTVRTETGDWSSSQYLLTERNATHRFHRQNGSGMNVAIYDGPELAAMKVGGENGTEQFRILDGGSNGSETGGEGSQQATKSGQAAVFLLAKLQTMPYEKVGTVERNGTTLTKYEATGPGYYATRENVTVESFDSTVLIDQQGLVRYFHHEVTYRRDGSKRRTETTLRYIDIGVTEVTIPEWLNEVR